MDNTWKIVAGVAIVAIVGIDILDRVDRRRNDKKKTEIEDLRAELKTQREGYLNKLEELKKEIASGIDVTVSNDIVKDAVDKAVQKQYDIAVRGACSSAIATVRSDISNEVDRAVKGEYTNIKEDVKAEIRKKIDSIDISSAKREVIEEAKYLAKDKLEDALDETIDDFKDDLNDISKLYKKMSESFIESATEKSTAPDKIILVTN